VAIYDITPLYVILDAFLATLEAKLHFLQSRHLDTVGAAPSVVEKSSRVSVTPLEAAVPFQ
jgi:hypothetical protein